MMSAGQILLLVALVIGVLMAFRSAIRDRISPLHRALRRARNGATDRALADLERMLKRRPASAAVHGALGQVHLLAQRYPEAEAELRQAVELGSRDALHHAGLGWALVEQGRIDEAAPFAVRANELPHEDFGVHCLYCGLMAHQGRGQEVLPVLEFLERRAIQMRKQSPETYDAGPGFQFEFALREMRLAGIEGP